MSDQALERPARIETARLVLVVLLPSEVRALIARDSACASNEAGVMFPPGWPESDDAREGLPWHLRYLESDERHRAWRVRVVVDRDTNLVVGSVNLKGPPDAEGDVEIGWGIAEAWRRRGYALEAVSGVLDWALEQPGTRSLTATIPDDNIASQRLAEKLGFVRTARVRGHKPVWYRSAALLERVAELIEDLQLVPHPEGGYYREIWRGRLGVEPVDGRGGRAALTSIYFLLPGGAISRWHRIRSDELWHHYEGAPLELLLVPPDELRLERFRLGPLGPEQEPMRCVPAKWWQAARSLGRYTLVGCTVGPGFEFSDFELLGDENELADALCKALPEAAPFR